MDLDQVMRMLKGKSEVKLVKFVSDKGPNSCEKCLAFHGRVFRADDPEKPELPIHPNCRCRYEELSESEVKERQDKILEIKTQLVELGGRVADLAKELIAEFEKKAHSLTIVTKGAFQLFPFVWEMAEVRGEKERRKIDEMLSKLQITCYVMEQLDQAARLVQQEMKKTGMDADVPALFSLPFPMYQAEKLLKKWHYDRLNIPLQQKWALPQTPEEAEKQGYIKAPDRENWYHRNKGQTGNMKYYHELTGQEVVFDTDGKIVTDSANIGTYNYHSPVDLYNKIMHLAIDVLPYYKWGNSSEDDTLFEDRLLGYENMKNIRSFFYLLAKFLFPSWVD